MYVPLRASVMRLCMTGWKQIMQWKRQLLENAAGVFGEARADQSTTTVEVKSLHPKIGQLALENDFLEGRSARQGSHERVFVRGSVNTLTIKGLQPSSKPRIVFRQPIRGIGGDINVAPCEWNGYRQKTPGADHQSTGADWLARRPKRP